MGVLPTFDAISSSFDFLNLPNCITTSVDETGPVIHVTARRLPPEKKCCPSCGQAASPQGRHWQRYVDRPIGGRPVIINLRTMRARCKNENCDRKTFQLHACDHFSGIMTRRCKSYIEDRCLKQTFASLAAETTITEPTVRRIAKELIAKLRINFRIDTPKILSIDEISLPSGKDRNHSRANKSSFPENHSRAVRTILSDGETSQVVDVLEDKEQHTLVNFLLHMQGARRIRYATIDMCETFRNAIYIALGPQVKIIADRWHVIKRINKVIDDERKSLKGPVRKSADHLRLALTARGTQLRHRNPKRHQELIDFLRFAPRLSLMYEAKEALLDIYDSPSRLTAERRYGRWMMGLRDEVRVRFSPVITMFANWKEEIFSYWESGYFKVISNKTLQERLSQGLKDDDPKLQTAARLSTSRKWVGRSNGRAEVRNQIIRQLNKMGRSYSFEVLRARAIFSTFEVHEHFGLCSGCWRMFRRERGTRQANRWRRAEEIAERRKYDTGPTCMECDGSSNGVPRPGAKPDEDINTHLGLATIWTESEPCLADDQRSRDAAERRRKEVNLRMQRRLKAKPSMPLLPALLDRPSLHAATLTET